MEEEKYDGEISEVVPRAYLRVFFFSGRSHLAASSRIWLHMELTILPFVKIHAGSLKIAPWVSFPLLSS